jgi:nitroreductase
MKYSENPVLNNMYARQSVREYSTTAVPADKVDEILRAAGRAASSKNTQPWQVIDVRGDLMEKIRADFLEAFDNNQAAAPDYPYSPNPLPDALMARARQVGYSLFEHKGIGRDDKEKRHAHSRENFRFFGAPHILLLTTDKQNNYGTFFDVGMLADEIMLGMTSEGIGSCPMYSVMIWPDIYRKYISAMEDRTFVCAIAYGYPQEGSSVNEFRTIREDLENWRIRLD